MTMRARLVSLAVIVVVCIAGAVAYTISASSKHKSAASGAPVLATTSLAQVEGAPHIVFRDTALGSNYGKIAMVATTAPDGARAIAQQTCDRVFATTAKFLCLSSDRGLVTTYRAEVVGTDLAKQKALPLAGIPSRARLSADGTLAATTSFTAGDSYAGTSFSTRTIISHLATGAADLNLESMQLIHNGAAIHPVDRNYWGVTFAADDSTFYATVAWGGKTWLAKGDLSAGTITTLFSDAECPSLSPDGSLVVFKKRNGAPAGHWRLASYDFATGKQTMLAETRNVDDQVEWLDNKTVLYGLPRSGSQAAIFDVFAVPADGSGAPRMFIPDASSPAVVR